MSAEETANATAGATEVAPEDEGFRVHIGNLSFKATEEQIKEYASSAGEIVSVTLPLKFGRPSGFAFVNYKTEAQANEAVEKLNDGELDGRKVTFAIARSREEQAARRESIIAKRQAAKEAREALKKDKADQAAADGTAVEDGDAEAKPKKKKSAKRTSRRRVPGEEGEEGDTTAVDATETDGAVTEDKPKKSKRKPSKAREARIDGAAEGDTSAEKPVKEKREPRPKLELSDKQSENTIFVANLPFTLDDEGLAAVFTNLSIEVTKATVVTRMRRGRGGKAYRTSRGFGFVEIANSAQQKEAVEKVEGSSIGERVLSAKIAQEMKEREIQEAAEASEEKPAEASEGAADATATA